MGMSLLWDVPDTSAFPSKKNYKEAYWANVKEKRFSSLTKRSLSSEFILVKDDYRLEAYWDCITRPVVRKLFHQFRVGSIPLRVFSSRWSSDLNDKCIFCGDCAETIPHMLFVCPAYEHPRVKWIKPVCQQLGTRSASVALRILRSATTEFIVIGLAKFLSWAWVIRGKKSRTELDTVL